MGIAPDLYQQAWKRAQVPLSGIQPQSCKRQLLKNTSHKFTCMYGVGVCSSTVPDQHRVTLREVASAMCCRLHLQQPHHNALSVPSKKTCYARNSILSSCNSDRLRMIIISWRAKAGVAHIHNSVSQQAK